MNSRKRCRVRALADEKLAAYRLNEAVKTAILRKSHPVRETYEPGEIIAFWREAKYRQGKKGQKGDVIPLFHSGDELGFDDSMCSPDDPPLPAPPASSAAGTDLTTLSPNAPTRAPGTPVDQSWAPLPEAKRARLDTTPEIPLATPELSMVPEMLEETAGVELEEKDVQEAVRSVGQDYWEWAPDNRFLVRYHSRPRQALYDPSGAQDLPVPLDKLCQVRTTVMDLPEGRKTVQDKWTSPNSNVNMDKSWSGYTVFKLKTDYDHHVLQVQPGWQNPQTMSRKDKKSLERELPWSAIPEEQKELYRQALWKEWQTWLKYEAVKVLDPECSRYVEENIDPSRILSARVCYRDKHAATPWLEVNPKARIVCRGDNDPDLLELRRDAPTLTRLGLMLLLQIAASWLDAFIVCADITGAFLQGDQSLARRREPLFIRQPKEGLPGLQAGQLLLVVRGIFGLANSPRLFWRFLRDNLIKLGFVQSTLDKALFIMYYQDVAEENQVPQRRLVLAIGAHVDDLICVGLPGYADHVLDKIRKQFDFGAWNDSREQPSLTYGGKTITKEADGTVTLSQEAFIRALTLTPVPKWRVLMKDSQLTAAEVAELKSGGGCLHWLVGQTRPDLAAGTSMNMCGQPAVANLVEINKLLKEAMKSQEWKMRFVPIELTTARMVAFSDASWANVEDLKSQAGYLVFITGPNVFSPEGDKASLVEWRSHRIRRRCRSTLAAETMALDAAADAALFTRELLAEMLIEQYQPTQSGMLDPDILPAAMATGCRSLYDLLVKDGPLSSTQEKRLTLDIGALREASEEPEPSGENMKEIYKWVPTDTQMADHLTKVYKELRDLLNQNHLALMAEEDEPPAAGPTSMTPSRGCTATMSSSRGCSPLRSSSDAVPLSRCYERPRMF